MLVVVSYDNKTGAILRIAASSRTLPVIADENYAPVPYQLTIKNPIDLLETLKGVKTMGGYPDIGKALRDKYQVNAKKDDVELK